MTTTTNRSVGRDTGYGEHGVAPLVVLLAGTFLTVLDFFIVNVALPSMQADLHADPAAIEWVVAGYALASAALLLVASRLGDRFGRRRVFTIGVALFTAASVACGLAPNVSVLVAGRVLQGVAAALVSATVLALIGEIYDGPARSKAIAGYAATMGIAAAGGQLLGGGLLAVDPGGLGWRTIFLVNVPIGMAAVAFAFSVVPESRMRRVANLDSAGVLFATLGLVALVLPLLEGRQHGWPWWCWVSLAVSPIFLMGFVVRQRWLVRMSREPLLDLRLFTSRNFSSGLVGQFLLWTGQASYFLVLALYLQQGRALSALAAGSVFTFVAASYIVSTAFAPRVITRYGRTAIAAGAVLLASGHLVLAASLHWMPTAPVVILAPGMLLAGAGMGLCIPALTGVVMADATAADSGAIAGTLSTVQQVGNAVGVAVVGGVYFSHLGDGSSHAFQASLIVLTAALIILAAVSWLLPSRARSAGRPPAEAVA